MRIIGYGVCGADESKRRLEGTLKEFKRLCDDVIICLNRATQAEKKLIESYGFKWYEDNREWGIYQPHIKEELVRKWVAPLNPDWCICLDMDEQFAPEFTREKAEELAQSGGVGWYFYFLNMFRDVQVLELWWHIY